MSAQASSEAPSPGSLSAATSCGTLLPSAEREPEEDWLNLVETPESLALSAKLRQGAVRLREELCGVPFYAKKAQQAKEAGDEMDYWVSLFCSGPNRYPNLPASFPSDRTG